MSCGAPARMPKFGKQQDYMRRTVLGISQQPEERAGAHSDMVSDCGGVIWDYLSAFMWFFSTSNGI
jgi:hypothetical protein